MKALLIASFACLVAFAPPALACGTRLPEIQRKIDAAQLQRLRELTVEAAQAADQVVIGTVTALVRPVPGSGDAGSVTLAVSETLKGRHLSSRVLAWSDAGFVVSCDETDSFNNGGLRDGGDYIVYVREGRVVRAAAADELRASALLELSEERELVAGGAWE